MLCCKRRGDSAGQVPLRANPVKYQKFNMSLGNPITAVYTEKSERTGHPTVRGGNVKTFRWWDKVALEIPEFLRGCGIKVSIVRGFP